jgi:uncharacterized protein YwgA
MSKIKNVKCGDCEKEFNFYDVYEGPYSKEEEDNEEYLCTVCMDFGIKNGVSFEAMGLKDLLSKIDDFPCDCMVEGCPNCYPEEEE